MAEDRITIATLRKLLNARTGLNEKVCGDFIDALLKTITTGLQNDKQVRINGLGTFKVQWNEPRRSINIQTGEPILIEGYNKVTFTPDSTLKERVNEPFAHLEAIVIDETKPQEKTEIDPMEKFGEQAEEIKGLLAELGAISNEQDKQEEQQAETKTEEEKTEETKIVEEEKTVEKEKEKEKKEEVGVVEVEEKPQENHQEEPIAVPQGKEETPKEERISSEKVRGEARVSNPSNKKDKPFQPWKVAGITVLCFCFLLVAGYFFLQHKITTWADSLLNKGEAVAVVEENDEAVVPDSVVVCPAHDSIAVMPDTLTQESLAESSVEEQSVESNINATRSYTEFIKTETLTEGSRLAWLSKKYYGAKDFWVYIYEANKDILPDPNAIPVGTQIRIPHLPKELIDTNNPESMQQAKALQDAILNK